MAAGLGFKTFAVGEVLTAGDTNGYLMQGVLVFASATARDAAITSPQEGQFAYLKDTNVTTYYTGSAWANLDTTGMTNPMTTTGDTIYSSSGSTPARLGIGSTGQVLTVAGGVPTWATPASGASFAGCSLTNTSTQNLPSGSQTTLLFDNERYDTDGFHSTSTNTDRITIPTGKGGYYLVFGVQSSILANNTGQTAVETLIYKNGSYIFDTYVGMAQSSGFSYPCSNQFAFVTNLAAGDYINFQIYNAHSSAATLYPNATLFFGVSYLGA